MKYIFSWPAVVVFSCAVIVLSVLPLGGGAGVFPFADKVFHCLMYAGIAFLAVNTFILKRKLSRCFSGFFYAFLLGLMMEFTQFFLPYRSFEAADIFFNFLGSALGCLLVIV